LTGSSNGRGAPKGNRNAITSGVYAFLANGRYPKGAAYIGRLLGQLRHSLEQVVQSRNGEVSLYQGAVIQSCCRHEGRAQLLQRWLRELDKDERDSSISERVSILKEIGSATDARDRCLKLLKLDHDEHHDVLQAIYSEALLVERAGASDSTIAGDDV
jgi:hypothetical protein